MLRIVKCHFTIRNLWISTVQMQKTAGRELFSPNGGLPSVQLRRESGVVSGAPQSGLLPRPAGALVLALVGTALSQQRIGGQGIARTP